MDLFLMLGMLCALRAIWEIIMCEEEQKAENVPQDTSTEEVTNSPQDTTTEAADESSHQNEVDQLLHVEEPAERPVVHSQISNQTTNSASEDYSNSPVINTQHISVSPNFITEAYDRSHLFFIRRLGQPSACRITLLHDARSHRMVVKKIIPNRHRPVDLVSKEIAVAESCQEIDQFLKIYGYLTAGPERSTLYMEYFDSCTLDTYFDENIVTTEALRKMMYQILLGLYYMHNEAHVTHRNINGSNILVNKRYKIKIIGFGFSEPSIVARGYAGTPGYCAPEIVAQLFSETAPQFYGTSCDMYSFGATIFNILVGRLPGYDPVGVIGSKATMEERKQFFRSGVPIARDGVKYPSGLDPSLEKLLSGLLDPDPRSRLKACEAINHPFFTTSEERRLSPKMQRKKKKEETNAAPTEEAEGTKDSPVITHEEHKTERLTAGAQTFEGPQKKGIWKRIKGRFKMKRKNKAPENTGDANQSDGVIQENSAPENSRKKSRLPRFVRSIFHPHKN